MIQKPKGTVDILPEQMAYWHYIEETARIMMNDYQFSEIRTPLFESFDLFARGVGDTTDIVTKEMYDFYDKGNRHIALRPEGTAPIVRAFVEHKLHGPEFAKPYKVYYLCPMFRYERPQAGRQRQFHQLGVEAFGSTNPAIDAEIIVLAMDFLAEIGVKHTKLLINSLGDHHARAAYRQALIDYLTPMSDQLSPDSQRRLHENPLRVLDSKDKADQEAVKGAPSILDFLSQESKAHFDQVKKYLSAVGIDYTIDTTMVRGLDYYQDTIFEIVVTDENFGAQSTICGGGRYDGLVEDLGGPQTPGFGFGLGIERLVLLMEEQKIPLPELAMLDIYLAHMGEEAELEAFKLAKAIRQQGFSAEHDFQNRKLKAQFKQANRQKAQTLLVLGEEELATGQVKLKHLSTGKEVAVNLEDLYENFDGAFRQVTLDTSVIDEFFDYN